MSSHPHDPIVVPEHLLADKIKLKSLQYHPNQDPIYVIHHAFVIYSQLNANDSTTGLRKFGVSEAFAKAGIALKENQIDLMFRDKQEMDFEEFFDIYVHIHQEQPLELFLSEWKESSRTKSAEVVEFVKPKPKISPLHDFIAGTFAGIILTLVGHPFDTVKVRLQTSNMFKSGLECAIHTARIEGFRALYRGMGGPLATVPLVNAIIFSAYGRARNFFEDSLPPPDPKNPTGQTDLTLVQHAIAGAVGGIANTFIVSPVELVKTQLQVQYNRPGEPATFRGPLHCAFTIWRMQGIPGIFRGFIPTLIREIPGYAGQFYTYEMLKRYLSTGGFSYVNQEKLGGKEMMLAGGVAGIGAWIFCYPQDVVKSRLQADHTGSLYPRHRWIPDGGFISAWKEVVRDNGQKGLWRGFGTCVLRAFPANAAAFLGYEAVLSIFHERNVSYF